MILPCSFKSENEIISFLQKLKDRIPEFLGVESTKQLVAKYDYLELALFQLKRVPLDLITEDLMSDYIKITTQVVTNKIQIHCELQRRKYEAISK